MDCSVTVHLIRHEKTQANLERKYIGWTDEAISHAIDVEPFLQPVLVYGSDLIRCKQTANAYFPQAEYRANAQLRELNFGDFEMKTYEQLQHNMLYRAWIDDPFQVTPPNGESFTHFQARVVQAFQQIIHRPDDYIFVVHGGVIRILLALFGQAQHHFQQITANHRTVYTLRWDSFDRLKEEARCTLYSEAHITEKGHL